MQDLACASLLEYLAYHILNLKLVPVNCLNLMVKHALLVETILQIDVVSLKHYKKKQVTSDNML